MTNKHDLMNVATSVLKLGLGSVLALCLVQCSAEQEGNEAIASVQQAVTACGVFSVPTSTTVRAVPIGLSARRLEVPSAIASLVSVPTS
jgi:hypothetical protein